MSKLIDADDFLDLFYVMAAGQDKSFIKAVEQVVSDVPTIDAVPVVRCGKCKYSKADIKFEQSNDLSICTKYNRVHKDDFFCYAGEKKIDS